MEGVPSIGKMYGAVGSIMSYLIGLIVGGAIGGVVGYLGKCTGST